MTITPSDKKRVEVWDERRIVACMFTKRQTAYLDDYWVLGFSGNCCLCGSHIADHIQRLVIPLGPTTQHHDGAISLACAVDLL
jgi:hypothetical protein